MKVNKPKVLIHKHQNDDSYTISITDDSDDMHQGVLMITAGPNGRGVDYDVWVMAAYYMAAELKKYQGGLNNDK